MRYDVLAVGIETKTVRILDTDRSWNAADGVVSFAVFRLGVESEFYVAVPTGSYVEGDTWTGQKQTAGEVEE